ncbi:hypothetical protein [Teichococcus oryzae]|uniref:Uncharacterized protein n=1 Tax=Teichococcus oryzae TaxID=1608942 RepID=A0A5B2TGF3_9PROT|nr:hypothetical protein [Pseudoroseomonas oryzae]KAA2213183.1 hypothetical protein F0Q34_11145 [Pseudoroseomonas oryzae]
MPAKTRLRIASPEEDPNTTIVCNSPPCFMHELDPSWLGYLRREEVAGLLTELLEAEPPGTVLETTWLRVMLRQHLARLGDAARMGGGHANPGADGAGDAAQAPLAQRLRAALPRIHDDALRRDLADVLLTLEHGLQRVHRRAMPG